MSLRRNVKVIDLADRNSGMSSEFILSSEPDLRDPSLIIGLPDVGYVGLRVIDYLKSKLGAEEFGHIEPAPVLDGPMGVGEERGD